MRKPRCRPRRIPARWRVSSPRKTWSRTSSSPGLTRTRQPGKTRPATRCSTRLRSERCSGAVSEQLLDKVVSYVPGHRLNGGEIVTLVKHSARSGLGRRAQRRPESAVSDIAERSCFEAGPTKRTALLSSRLMGWVMGAPSRKVEKKEGRDLADRAAAAAAGAPTAGTGWAWWAEKNDLVVGFMDPACRFDHRGADGKNAQRRRPRNHQGARQDRGQIRAGLLRICSTRPVPREARTGFDVPDTAFKTRMGCRSRRSALGIRGRRACVGGTLVAAKPAQGVAWPSSTGRLSTRRRLLPMPDQIDSFIETSISTRHLLEVDQADGALERGQGADRRNR